MNRAPFIAMLWLLAWATHARATLLVHADAAPASATIAQTITLTITASTPRGWVIRDPVPPIEAGAALGPFTIISADRAAPILTPSGRLATTITVTLAPGLPGPASIPAISLTATEPGSVAETVASTDPIAIEIRSVLDGIDPESFTPGTLLAPIVPEAPSLRVPFGIIIACVVTAGTALIAIAVSRARHPRTAPAKSGPARLDALIAAALPPARLAQGASAIVRDTLAESIDPRFRTASAGPETELLLRSVGTIPADERITISTFLADAERIACAPASDAHAAERLADAARACLAIAASLPPVPGGGRP